VIRYARRAQIGQTLVIVEVACDRCGLAVERVHGVGVPSDFDGKGATVRGNIYPSHNAADALIVDAELCARCTDDLTEWIADGAGAGVRVRSASAKAHDLTRELRG
jgi:hypothetical protein